MARVIVIGGANVDIKGKATGRYLNYTSNPGEVTVSPGGVGRNIAENLARLGIETALVTSIGHDAHGEMIRAAAAAAGVALTVVDSADAPTGVYLATLTEEGEMVSAVNDMRAAEAMTPDALSAHRGLLEGAAMIVADCNLPRDALQFVCDEAARLNAPILIEPVSDSKARKVAELRLKRPIDYATPNQMQILALTGMKRARDGIAILHQMGVANLAVHWGEDGAFVSDGAKVKHIMPLHKGPVLDVTGAGDASVAGLVFGLVTGRGLFAAARLGQAAAAIALSSSASVASGLTRDRVLAMAGLPQDT